MKFRLATHDDAENLLELCKEFHAEGRFAYIPFSSEKARAIGDKAMRNPTISGILVAVSNNKIVGFSHCTAGEYFVGTGPIITTVQAIYVSSAYRKSLIVGKAVVGLLTVCRQWAKSRSSAEMIVLTNSGIEAQRTARVFARSGFEALGGNYVTRIS